MATTVKICIYLMIFFAVGVGAKAGWPVANLTVRVIGEDGQRISGAKVEIGFREMLSDKNAWVHGETDRNGQFSAQGYSDKRLGGTVRKEGYYDGGTGWVIFKDPILGRWQPWGTVAEVFLRPIGKPIAMQAKRVQVDIPALDQPVGYDLEVGAWVFPHGRGKTSDLIFKVTRAYSDRDNFKVEAEVKFAQRLDGFVRMKAPIYSRNSAYRWERSAPERGYLAPHQISFASVKLPTHVNQEKSFESDKEFDQGYFFRVRTVEKDGVIISANYGKITGDIVIDPRDSKTCYVRFTYYFNPTSLDRNLEWDTKRNLLDGLHEEQTPRGP